MPEIYERVERKAKKLGISTNAFITMIIAESVKK
jgi:predicted HicB family RNase H-like nuclease